MFSFNTKIAANKETQSFPMAGLDGLKPINSKHSIRETVISIFLAQPVLKPSRFQVLLNGPFKSKFDKFDIIKKIKLGFTTDATGKISNKPASIGNDSGFSFKSFVKGDMEKVLQLMNEDNRQFISFHTFRYERWAPFLAEFEQYIKAISTFQPGLFTTAYSLHVIDEFKWLNNSEIPIGEIFREDSGTLPQNFFKSSNTLFSLVSEIDVEGHKYADRLEVKVDSKNAQIRISHNITQRMSDISDVTDIIELQELIEGGDFSQLLSLAHNHNKSTLKNVLKEEVQQLIGLTNDKS